MRKNVTFIDDLFDADSMGSEISKVNNERDEFSYQIKNRHIRANNERDNIYSVSSGMNTSIQPFQPDFQQLEQPMQMQPMQMQPMQMQRQPFMQHLKYYDEEISCIAISNHIKECPICSKFYNCDNSMYIVCIVLLIIVCIILLKRIIEKN